MIAFLFFVAMNVICLIIGAHFYGPILNATGAATDWIKARFAKK